MDENGANLQSQTLHRIRNAMQGGTFVGMPEVLRLIQELSTKAFSISLNELAEIIEQDVAVTARIIGTANTVAFNPTGAQVATVSQAIQITGFEKVRNLAISYLLADSATQPIASEEQRETAAFALASGLFAQSLAVQRGFDPELVFVCTAFRSYGRLLLTAYLPDEYSFAKALSSEIGKDRAFRETFGLSPLELSYELLKEFLIPKYVLRTLQRVPALLAQTASRNEEDKLFVLTEYSERICALVMDATLDAGQFKTIAETLGKEYARAYNFSADEIAPALQSALAHYNSFGVAHGVRRSRNATIRLAVARSENANPPEDIVQAQKEQLGRSGELLAEAESLKESFSKKGKGESRKANPAIVENAVKQIEELLKQEKPDVEAIQMLVVTSFGNAVSLDCGMLLRIDPDGRVRVLAEMGEVANNLHRPVEAMDVHARDVFGISIARKEDVLIEDVRLGNVLRYIPVWLKLNSPVMSLLILPILSSGEVVGLFFGLRCRGEPLGLNTATLQALRSMRQQVASLWQIH